MLCIEIRFKGQLNNQWSGLFNGLIMNHSDPAETILTGIVSDQSALYKEISHLRDLGVQITSVSSEDIMDQNPP